MGCGGTLDQDVIGGECSGDRVLDDFDVRKGCVEFWKEGSVEVGEEDRRSDLVMVFEEGDCGYEGVVCAVDDKLRKWWVGSEFLGGDFSDNAVAEWWFARSDFDEASVVTDRPVGKDVFDCAGWYGFLMPLGGDNVGLHGFSDGIADVRRRHAGGRDVPGDRGV